MVGVHMRVLLTVNIQRNILSKEGFSFLRLCPLAWADWVLRHQFEEVKEEIIKGAVSFKILGIMSTQLQK